MNMLNDSAALNDHICSVLQQNNHSEYPVFEAHDNLMSASAVLFLLGGCSQNGSAYAEPCLILNKRSHRVKQPGDLCFPGGGLAPRLDPLLSKLLSLPLTPLTRWPHWDEWRTCRPENARRMSLFLATGLREGFEEMRLNPIRIRFLGPLPSQRLVMFHRVIYPMVAWVKGDNNFTPNWEVEKVVYIPLKKLLDGGNYARLHLHAHPSVKTASRPKTYDTPCFLHQNHHENEYLWGATYRVVQTFLQWVFGFHPPKPDTLQVVEGTLGETYLTGGKMPLSPR